MRRSRVDRVNTIAVRFGHYKIILATGIRREQGYAAAAAGYNTFPGRIAASVANCCYGPVL